MPWEARRPSSAALKGHWEAATNCFHVCYHNKNV